MDFRSQIRDYSEAPIARHVILDILKDYRRPNDKISELIKSGQLISVRRGLYLAGPQNDLPAPVPFLVANHLRGPSYVSLESALSHWNMIPERVHEVTSVTIKSSRSYKTPIGRFSYVRLGIPYYSYGIKILDYSPRQSVLIASPEKALCDIIVLTSGVNLRSVKGAREFVLDDLRIDEESLLALDAEMMELWLEHAPKRTSLEHVINMLNQL